MNAVFLLLGIIIGAAGAFLTLKYMTAGKYAKYLSENDVAEKYVLREIYEKEKEIFENLHEQMKIQFENTANKILEENSKKFTEINEEKIGVILNPLKEKITDFQKKVEETYSNEIREKASLQQELRHIIEMNKQMTAEADKLTRALKGDSKVQGDWGEFQLEVLLEKSGLTEGANFKKQQSFKTDENENIRPDFIIYLPENKHYIIDSKVSLTAYEQYFNSEDDTVKEKALKEHIASIKRHIDELSDKKYEQISAVILPDFVFMFVPVESALTIAVQANPTLVEYALKKNVMLVVPTTLMFAMRAIAFIWKVEKQNKNVQEIAKVGGELYDKFVNFTDNMIKVGQSMDSTKKIYTDVMGQLTKDNLDGTKNAGTILGKMENLKILGANTTKQINQSLLSRTYE